MRLLPLLLLAACGGTETPAVPARATPLAIASFYPVAYFAERIGGSDFEVRSPLPEGADPATWRPDAKQLAEIQSADLILVNGAHFEEWVGEVSLPASRLVQTADVFRSEWIEYEGGGGSHSHGDGCAHSHEGTDGHTWVDPQNAKRQARAILVAMQKRLPAKSEALEARFDALAAELDTLDRAFLDLPPAPPLLASHPAYNYIARRYDWKVKNFDLDPEEMPSDGQLDAIVKEAEEAGAPILLWEGEPLPEIAARIRERGGPVSIFLSPIESRPPSGDYLSAMETNLDRLGTAFTAAAGR